MLGHAGRASSMRAYCTALLLPGERKSIELMAARIRPGGVRAAHQSMHHFAAKAGWDDAAVLGAVRERVLPAIEQHGPVRHWAVEDIGFPKQGIHSVGVARQSCGSSGKQDDCQVAVSLSVANEHASLPIGYRLHLPRTWVEEPARCGKAGVPEGTKFETKAATALDQVRQARADGIPAGVVLSGPGYGDEARFRSGLSGLSLLYALGVQPSIGLWPPLGLPGGRRRPSTLRQHGPGHGAVLAKALALSLPPRAWRKVTWHEGRRTGFSSRFAAVRVHPAHHDAGAVPCAEQWLLVEWPESEAEPTEYWLSNLPPCTTLKLLVRTAKGRWRTKRDVEGLKQVAGLGHYEGRGWRGFHHHASLCIATYGFVVADRCLFSSARRFTPGCIIVPQRSPGFRPRGSTYAARADEAAFGPRSTLSDARLAHAVVLHSEQRQQGELPMDGQSGDRKLTYVSDTRG